MRSRKGYFRSAALANAAVSAGQVVLGNENNIPWCSYRNRSVF